MFSVLIMTPTFRFIAIALLVTAGLRMSAANPVPPVYSETFKDTESFGEKNWHLWGDVALVPNPTQPGKFCVALTLSEKSELTAPDRPFRSLFKPRTPLGLVPGKSYMMNINVSKEAFAGPFSTASVEILTVARFSAEKDGGTPKPLVVLGRDRILFGDLQAKSIKKSIPVSVPNENFRPDGYDYSIGFYGPNQGSEKVYIESVEIVEVPPAAPKKK
jgi:hypothetical protein